MTKEINKLEQNFFELLQYSVIVKSGLYARYYFELRALFKNEAEFPLTPLDSVTASLMEQKSESLQKDMMAKSNTTVNEYKKKTNAMIN